ncbi:MULTISPECIES: beta-N-acetylglucosaminidase domain-containing protein [Streptomyces]|uniref:beta-N-acetylglucosaminidase domain-containing protein n=1 Tax=Streptomyces TaxID=1883 RepID=UPI001CCD636C|nr:MULTISPECIES: beta-N-acetylglucosaminidase domain-containing protein [Streptomyces]UBI38817.1 beta-N-acetylglucosaminidase domain-containing protein [Streptomyces mobaraensis]UKW31397.1 beta-N-acetylglucosaminidase domain-containing protein [Streptomyces sp. TYQ1024]
MRFQGDDPSCGDQGPEQHVRGASERPADRPTSRPASRPGRALGTGRFGGPYAVRPRRAGVTVLAVALLGGLLGNAPVAAAPAGPAAPAAGSPDAADPEGSDALPPVWPRPQSGRAQGAPVPVGTEVTLMAEPGTDPYTLTALREVLRGAGARTVVDAQPGGTPPPRGLIVYAGGRQAEDALRTLGAPAAGDLPKGGYRLASGQLDGRPAVALAGVGDDGLFHAAQTLRQLVVRRDGGTAFAGAVIRDWPVTAVRGITEGFYGQPWSTPQRLAQLDFMGRTKLNRYLYAPGDDPYRQAKWRDPYPADRREEFRALAERARRNHVTLGWAVAPGQAMCFSSEEDVRALKRKVDAMWALGVRAFQLQFQDVSYSEWHCGADRDAFGSGPKAAAEAQAKVAGALSRHLAAKGGEAVPLSLLPTEYYQDGRTAFRRALADRLDPRVEVTWTGVGVVPRTITGGELAAARAAFGHQLVTMDNYPVNDFAQDRIFLGPYTGREPAVAVGSAALLANASAQPTASRIPLFTTADYAWNPRGYRPEESWKAAVDDLAGADPKTREALRALAGNDASSVLGGEESAYLRPLMDDFWTALSGTDADRLKTAADRLRAAFRTMADAPGRLTDALGTEVRPWVRQLARHGEAGLRAVDMLTAQARGDGADAWRAELDVLRLRDQITSERVTVGAGVLTPFLQQALARANGWLGVDRPLRTSGAATDGDPATTVPAPADGPLTVKLREPHPMTAVTVLTAAAPGARGTVEAHTPDKGWQPLGPLAAGGWTQLPGKGVRADALRLVWSGPTRPAAVHEITPWFADTAATHFELTHAEATAEAGGAPAVVEARVINQRPGAVKQKLTVRAPKGVTVKAPDEVTAVRGGVTTLRVELSVPADAPSRVFTVPVRLGDQERTVTVRAYPAAGGPDLARTGEATSSGDEASDFPPFAALDGNPKTRWSSPPADDAWWQLQLPRPTRLGRLVLHWQDELHATRYRVQVSPDGRTWRDAATVTDGKGGTETVRCDAPGTRFVRVQGVKRAAESAGYSLVDVEAYAVRKG